MFLINDEKNTECGVKDRIYASNWILGTLKLHTFCSFVQRKPGIKLLWKKTGFIKKSMLQNKEIYSRKLIHLSQLSMMTRTDLPYLLEFYSNGSTVSWELKILLACFIILHDPGFLASNIHWSYNNHRIRNRKEATILKPITDNATPLKCHQIKAPVKVKVLIF